MTVADNDLGVVASSALSVEDLHRDGSHKRRRNRLVRHRAQKRYRKTSTTLPRSSPPAAEDSMASLMDFPSLPSIKSLDNTILSSMVISEAYKHALVSVPLASSVPYVPICRSMNRTHHYKPASIIRRRIVAQPPKCKSNMSTFSKLNLASLRLARPIVDLCRDRRRRVTSIKRGTPVVASRKDIAKDLSAMNKGAANANLLHFEPVWARFSLPWNQQCIASDRTVTCAVSIAA
ncbi:hypothetical protein SpCBS45565_g03911 [Spizellomyces sp. 'palustris']|nr:hypothetical protein SpCBS45565_g03911 [Spizellomyces sp. 'palustris']